MISTPEADVNTDVDEDADLNLLRNSSHADRVFYAYFDDFGAFVGSDYLPGPPVGGLEPPNQDDPKEASRKGSGRIWLG